MNQPVIDSGQSPPTSTKNASPRWRPLPPERLDLSPEDWKKQHDEISRAINKLLLVLIGFCFFCGLALGQPDVSLLASNAKVTLPFANTDISFVAFLIIAPLVLTALSFYLHIFIGYWTTLSRQQPTSAQMHPVLPFIFNLNYRTTGWLSNFLFYWLVPGMLAVFTWKALPRPEGPILTALTSGFVVVFLFLQIRRRPDQTSKLSTSILWLALLGSILMALIGERLHRPLFLEGAELEKQHLQSLDLRGAHLSDAHLNGADLSEADLTGANLNGADLSYADLTGALLSGELHLNPVDLTGASLTGADLTGADLAGVGLSKVDGLTQQQIDKTLGNQKTGLPTGISKPK